MDMIVCIKQVPDTAAEITPTADGTAIQGEGIPWVMNPYDEYALEEALRTKERLGGAVTAICMGPASAVSTLRTAVAMGADNVVHLVDAAFEGSDPHAAARALCAAIKGLKYDVIWCGKMAVDDACGYVGTALAELLGVPHIAAVVKVEIADGKVTAHRETEAGTAVLRCPLPAVLTAEKGLNEPRYPKAIDIMKAKRKEIQAKSAAEIGVSADAVGAKGSLTRVAKFERPPERGGGTVIEAPVGEAVRRLVTALREQAKVL
jgi:electron transfer flavoprotein beta subunit